MIFECPGSKPFKQPVPGTVKCPFCGSDVEIWSDEFQATCERCKKTVSKDGTQSCLDWCKEAKDCVGDEIYKRYLESRKKKGEK